MARMYPDSFPRQFVQQRSLEHIAYESFYELPDDFHIAYEPRIPRDDGTALFPDFVVVSPFGSVIVFEAKNWRHVIGSDGHRVSVRLGDGQVKTLQHPLRQARGNMFAVKSLLERQGELVGERGLRFPLAAGVLWLNRDGNDRASVATLLGAINERQIITMQTLQSPTELSCALEYFPTVFKSEIYHDQAEIIMATICPHRTLEGNDCAYSDQENRQHEEDDEHMWMIQQSANAGSSIEDTGASRDESSNVQVHGRTEEYEQAIELTPASKITKEKKDEIERECANVVSRRIWHEQVESVVNAWFQQHSSMRQLEHTMKRRVEEAMPSVEVEIRRVFSQAGVNVRGGGRGSLAVDEVCEGLADGVADQLTIIIGAIITTIVAAICGGGGTAVIASGPLGLILGGGAALWLLLKGKDDLQRFVRKKIRDKDISPGVKQLFQTKTERALDEQRHRFIKGIRRTVRSRLESL